MIVLFFTAFLSQFSLFLRYNRQFEGLYTAFRLALLQTLVTQALLVFLFNEILSPVSQLTAANARLFWGLLTVGQTAALVLRLRQTGSTHEFLRLFPALFRLDGLRASDRWLLYGVLLTLLLPLFLLAVYAPPSNLDSHNYHLNRILLWGQNANVDHFPTLHIQQLYHNVGAEYLMLHPFLLAGGDQWVNLVQFGAMLGSVAAVSLLARHFGAGPRRQLVAALLQLLLPIGILESTTTQNDYTACFFFLTFVLLGYRLLAQWRTSDAVWWLFSLSLAGFAKYPALFFALPFALYFGFRLLRQHGPAFGLKTSVGALLVFAFVFGPFFARNYALFQHPLSPQPGHPLFSEKIPVDRFGPASTLSTFSKNVGLHLALPHGGYNRAVDAAVTGFHRLIGIAPDDPCLSIDHYHTRFSMQEDMAPNTFHFLLLLLTAGLLLARRGNPDLKLLLALAVAGLLLFSTFLKFQLWASRPCMLFFAVGCVLTGLVLPHRLPRFTGALLLPPLLVAVGCVYGNPNKMLLPLRYLAKKATAHVPRDICPASEADLRRFRLALSSYYATDQKAACFPLKRVLSYSECRVLFDKLDSLDYFRVDQENFVFATGRAQAYFASHPADYRAFAPLLPHLRRARSIGVLMQNELGFYHYWSALACQTEQPPRMAYIRYKEPFAGRSNTRPFDYEYVFTDNPQLFRNLLPPASIAEVHCSGPLFVIRLKKPACQTYVF